ncbi:MAG: hypothetical protein COT33_01170 [Candidatus Nealsonbacteria bacterium CG08_land_8_20_14_0_20_38_20]|uniref:Uncharacterized protein n=1 Tax=Candidatus Nealsonbacteria bacterium CG08_land_8_20_14_0_20_38_20 TaxID=1974705 RepID=A0A2H0YM60_9BACT|nr:MAG: hypothetical protein COT33_01170 [Candidatus Nealsonbacteria bacterium CG08_land_8_20_14_0_20_38_20]
MATITIPKNLMEKGDLVIIPRKEYEGLLHVAGRKKKRTYTQIDKDLDEAIAEYKAGKYFGPFDNVKDLMKSLKSRK